MPSTDFDAIRSITDFPSLIRYLRKELGWPVDEEQVDDLTFEYTAAELGIDERLAVKIKEVKQLRPLTGNQPWGVFWIQFEQKRLPVVVMRRILSALVKKQRGGRGSQKTWDLPDLMFISATGAGNERGISFAHFQYSPLPAGEGPGVRAQLRTFAWDVKETHLYYIKNLNLNALRWPADARDADAWRRQWSEAFTVSHRYVPTTAEMLAKKMAQIASYIREVVELTYSMEHAGGSLHQLHLSLKLDLISDLSEDDFADMYAQTVTYGLFAARATRSGDFAKRPVGSSTDATALIAHTNPFLRELLEQMMNQQSLDLDELGVTELTDLLGKVNMEAILQDFGRQKRGEDPVIHFYETFMRAYDPQQKTKRGEFYTPDAVVSFIVRSVDYLLRTEFDCPDGLATPAPPPPSFRDASPKSTPDLRSPSPNPKDLGRAGEGFSPVILDPAAGTGTFLKYVIEVIWETFYEKNKKMSKADRTVKWNRFVRANVLPRLYAFELKMSPYTIAHMKVGLALQEKGFDFEDGERLRIYLSNALQPAHEVARTDTPALAHEVEHSNEVKNNVPVSVVIGNPPYAVTSANNGEWITNQVRQNYYPRDEIKEQNPKMLLDDYVKFIRFGEWRIGQSGAGIVAMITNHGYLDNPTFRAMRQQLMQSFDKIYVLDLHGNTKKKETAPDGSKDENVFDIQQGVAICLMVKSQGTKGIAKVFRADLFGTREYKYEWLLTHHRQMGSIKWVEIAPKPPFTLWTQQETELTEEYQKSPKITDIFSVNSSGLNSLHDDLVIHFDRHWLENMMADATNAKMSNDEFREKYQVVDSRDWKLAKFRTKAIAKGMKKYKDTLTKCLYRPFDERWIVLDDDFVGYARWETTEHFLNPKSLGLATSRQSLTTISCLAGKVPFAQHKIVDPYNRSYIFPLYLYPGNRANSARNLMLEGFGGMGNEDKRRHNISENFTNQLQKLLGMKFVPDGTGDLHKTFGPEDVFYYMYAVFHSPAYRSRYAQFLKIDFPRLPLTGSVELFHQLCALGKELVTLHLLEHPLLTAPDGLPSPQDAGLVNPARAIVAKGYPKYTDGKVYVNETDYFAGVPADVWEFHIGGYQVCEKWLKDRRGRALSEEDIDHYHKIIAALGETIHLMKEVDEVIDVHGGWPLK